MRRTTYVLVLLALAATPLGACAREGEPEASARAARGEGASMSEPVATDLAWLDRVVALLHDRATTEATLAGFFGVDRAAASDGWTTASRYGLAGVRILDLSHVAIDVAVEVVFAEGSRPRLADVEARLGRGRAMPRRPDDLAGGSQVAFYPERRGSAAQVRVFATLAPGGSGVTNLQLDRSFATGR